MDARISNYVGRVGERGVRVDRDSILGNPFVITRRSTRQVVIAQYAIYLRTHIEELWPTLFGLRGTRLLCHCRPERCHAEVLALVANGIKSTSDLADAAWDVLQHDLRLEYLATEAECTPLHTPFWMDTLTRNGAL